MPGAPAWACDHSYLISRGGLSIRLLVVVHRFPKTDPDVHQAEPGTQSADEAIGDEVLQCRVVGQNDVAGPFVTPGKHNQNHAQDGTEKYEQQDRNPVPPQWHA